VWLKLGSPVIYSQARPGLAGRLFTLYKFRTMSAAVDSVGRPRREEQRLTSFGRFLRATSLDELPELWNVLRGEMSLVGPRPLLPEYLALYTPDQARRHNVRPGITGLAQINGRNAIAWEAKFAYDTAYVDSVSFKNDVVILLKTVWCVLWRRDVNADTNCSMRPFTGSLRPNGIHAEAVQA
jgi:lipopolysaccharide/colanic/teichoic acid biosynthesis glycosyltransferase